MPLIYFLIFCVIAIVELYAEATSNVMLRFVFKPLVMISLISFFTLLSNKRSDVFYIFLVAFLFALAGDVLLMFTDLDQNFFLFGLAAFLLTHVLYIIGIAKKSILHFNLKKITGILFVFIISAVLLFSIWKGLNEMAVPVILYTIAIASMMVSAIIHEPETNRSAYILILCGAALFMLSDSLIAINKFGGGLERSSLLIMTTYIAAQFYIVNGAIIKINSTANS
ncbi:MAG: lysoplasmalogenase [Chitinophagales bacterium]|nr:lysoplasmalogenase [Chitinophagales bacterium]